MDRRTIRVLGILFMFSGFAVLISSVGITGSVIFGEDGGTNALNYRNNPDNIRVNFNLDWKERRRED